MLFLILGLLSAIAGVYAFSHRSATGRLWRLAYRLRYALIVVGIALLASRSFVYVGANEAGHLNLVYFGSDLPPGRIIALRGEKGPQARLLPPGFHFIPLVRVLYDVEFASVVEVKEGQYALLLARDGQPLRESQFLADPWPEDQVEKMLDAEHFLSEGRGQKGPQLTVLRPGRYRLNRYLFDVQFQDALDVPTGHVAVVRSNVQTTADCPAPDDVGSGTDTRVATPIVPKGCIGVWAEPIRPGRYYLNARAFVTTIIPTRVQTWTYKGGYTQRAINLRVNDNGTIEQVESSTEESMPKDAADRAIFVRVEGCFASVV